MMTLRVRVQTGQGAPFEYGLDGAEVIIGRALTAAIVIPDSRVSRQHARFVQRDGAWWIEDLGARNRLLLNGVPLQRAEMIRAGDRLDVADAVLRIVAEGEPSTPEIATSAGGDAARIWTIHEIHRALATPLSLSELLDVILARCFDVLDPEEGAILLRGPDGALVNAASRRRPPDPTPVTIPRRLIEEVMGKGQPALVLDAAGDDRFAGSASFISSGIRSIVAAPIVDAEGMLGLITLCSRVAVRRFAQPDLDMLVSLASAAALRVRNVALAEELAARRVVEHELALAHEVQMAMLPRAMPAREGLALAGQLKPARSVGGDLYDVVLEGDRLWFIVADVAGKSIAAALYMAIARALFRASVRGAADVAIVAARMNEELARDNETMMFVTAALGCLDLRTGRVALVDAGHNPMLVCCGAEVREVSGVPKGTAFGVVPDAVYVQGTVALPDGGVLVLYTDGVTDARSAAGQMYGDARLWEALTEGGAAPATLVPHVIESVERFAAGTPPEDDLTLLALAYSPPRS